MERAVSVIAILWLLTVAVYTVQHIIAIALNKKSFALLTFNHKSRHEAGGYFYIIIVLFVILPVGLLLTVLAPDRYSEGFRD